MFPSSSAVPYVGEVKVKSIAPTWSYPILTKITGELSTTLLSIVMTITTRKTVKIPIFKALYFFVYSTIRYLMMTLQLAQHLRFLAFSFTSCTSSDFCNFRLVV